jgi:ribosomal protein S18 acetylase RimI-like enzyme
MVEDGGAAIGTSAVAHYDHLAWIAMMLVDPAQRRAGHGSRLLTAALDAAASAPRIGLDATPAGEPLYRKFGFVESLTLLRMAMWGGLSARHAPIPRGILLHSIASQECPDESGHGRPEGPRHIDRDVFGADRSRLLKSLLSRAPESAWMTDGGYCFGRPGHLYHQIGPIVANDLDSARALIAQCLAHLADRAIVIDVPLQHTAWIRHLISLGFREERRLLRMFLRGDHHPGDPSRQYAIAGPEFA